MSKHVNSFLQDIENLSCSSLDHSFPALSTCKKMGRNLTKMSRLTTRAIKSCLDSLQGLSLCFVGRLAKTLFQILEIVRGGNPSVPKPIGCKVLRFSFSKS